MLQDDLDGAPATTVGLDLPAHWRAFYWALAAWSVGATSWSERRRRRVRPVHYRPPDRRAGRRGRRPPDARHAPHAGRGEPRRTPRRRRRGPGAGNYGDAFAANEDPNPDDPALVDGDPPTRSGRRHGLPDWGANPRVRVPDHLTARSSRRSPLGRRRLGRAGPSARRGPVRGGWPPRTSPSTSAELDPQRRLGLRADLVLGHPGRQLSQHQPVLGVTSMTARSVMMRCTTPRPV